MKKFSTLFSAALVALSLASCNKESYTFRQSEAYHNSTASRVITVPATTAEAATVAPAPELTASIKTAPAAVAASTPKAARTYSAQVAPAVAATKAPSEVKIAKATLKEMRKAAKAAKVAAPAASGKSQLVALLLTFFLGGLGIGRFYLGYTGRGILYIALALTSFLIVPAIALFVLLVIDLVRIITGSLKPKGGDYAKKF